MIETARKKGGAIFQSEGVRVAMEVYAEGRFGDAVDLLRDELRKSEGDTRLEAVIALAKVEQGAGRVDDSLRVLFEHDALARATRDDRLAAKFHHGRAVSYQMLFERTGREDLADSSLIDYAATIYHLEKINDFDDAGATYNNVALINLRLGRFDDARSSLADARRMYAGRAVKLAQVDDTEAQILIAEEKYREAYGLMLRVQTILFDAGEWRLFDETRPTLKKALDNYQYERGKEGGEA